jgi:hypothetical protein
MKESFVSTIDIRGHIASNPDLGLVRDRATK